DFDVFVRKFDSSGSELWTTQLGTAGTDHPGGIAIDGGNNVYIAGYVSGSLDGKPFMGEVDLFVRKFDAAGGTLWTETLGTSSRDEALGLAIDDAGNLFVTGRTQLGLDGQVHEGDWDIFVTQYNGAGTRIGTRQIGTSFADRADA